jgi:hypothetical protein
MKTINILEETIILLKGGILCNRYHKENGEKLPMPMIKHANPESNKG